MRHLRQVLCGAAASVVCVAGLAQVGDSHVGTSQGGALVWRGPCVRGSAPRDSADDPCPRVISYIGRTWEQIELLKKSGKADHVLEVWEGPPSSSTVKVVDQWPRPEDFRDIGWFRNFSVFLKFDPNKPLACPTCKPDPPRPPSVEGMSLDAALAKLEGSPWIARVVRPDRRVVQASSITGEGRKMPVQMQRPASAAPDRNIIELLVAEAAKVVPPKELFKVPKLVGELPQDAVRIADAEKFKTAEAVQIRAKAGYITYQTPHAGTLAAAGTVIEYVIAGDITNVGPPVKVPSVLGCSVKEAVQRLQKASGVTLAVPKFEDRLALDIVVSQREARGAGDAGVAVSLFSAPREGLTESVREELLKGPLAENCELPPLPAACKTCEDVIRIVYRDVPQPYAVAGAGGAGLLGGYLLSRLMAMRRSRDDEGEEDSESPERVKTALSFRVHPDAAGEQTLERL